MNTFNNIINSPYQQYLTFESSNLYAFNAYTNLIQSATLNTSFITASNSIITSNLSCESFNVNSNANIKNIIGSNITFSNIQSINIISTTSSLSNISTSNIELGGLIINSSRQIRGAPTVNYGIDTLSSTGLDFYARSQNYHIGVCRSSNITLSNNPAGLNSCGGVNTLNSYAMRFRVLANNGSNGFIFQTAAETPLFTVNDQGLAYFNSNVGIGKANGGYQLDLSGDGARKLTNTTWTTGSDQRIKMDIQNADLDICYSNIKGINLKRFKWDSNIIGPVEDEIMLGFIAQEIKPIFPKSVKLTSDYGFNDFHNLNQDQLNKSLFGAVKKLIEKVENLENIVLNK